MIGSAELYSSLPNVSFGRRGFRVHLRVIPVWCTSSFTAPLRPCGCGERRVDHDRVCVHHTAPLVRLLGRPGEQSLGVAAVLAVVLVVMTLLLVMLVDRWATPLRRTTAQENPA